MPAPALWALVALITDVVFESVTELAITALAQVVLALAYRPAAALA